MYKSLRRAARDVETYAPDAAMGWRERQYGSGDVRLLLHPGPGMTWEMWEEAITGITEFVTHYQFLDMDFDILRVRLVVGTGFLTVF